MVLKGFEGFAKNTAEFQGAWSGCELLPSTFLIIYRYFDQQLGCSAQRQCGVPHLRLFVRVSLCGVLARRCGPSSLGNCHVIRSLWLAKSLPLFNMQSTTSLLGANAHTNNYRNSQHNDRNALRHQLTSTTAQERVSSWQLKDGPSFTKEQTCAHGSTSGHQQLHTNFKLTAELSAVDA